MMILDTVGNKLDQLGRMMSRAQITVPAAPYALETDLKGAVWRCLFCRHARECREWLGESHAERELPDFCPNAAMFRRHRQ